MTTNNVHLSMDASPDVEILDWLNYRSSSDSNAPRAGSADSVSRSLSEDPAFISSPELTSAGLKAWQLVEAASKTIDSEKTAMACNSTTHDNTAITPETDGDVFSIYSSSNQGRDFTNIDNESIISSIIASEIPAKISEKNARELKEALSGDISFQVKNSATINDLKAKTSQSQSNSSRDKNLRILDNLLILASQYIDDSPQSIYLVFPYLLRKIVEICDNSTTWQWADIYFRSLVFLIEKSKETRVGKFGSNNNSSSSSATSKSRPGSSTSTYFSDSHEQKNSESSSPFSQSSSKTTGFSFVIPASPSPFARKNAFTNEGAAYHRRSKLFQAYRTSFLVSLTCYLACKMADFEQTQEPGMTEIFTQHIIPTLADLCAQQKDVCDAPGIALMYIFIRLDVPIQDIIAEPNRQPGMNQEFGIDDKLLYQKAESCQNIGSGNMSMDTDSPPQTPSVFSSPKTSFISKYLEIIWIRCLAMGYYRRCWARQINEECSNQGIFGITPPLSAFSVKTEHYDSNNFVLAAKDRKFMEVYKNLVVGKYRTETDVTIKELYEHLFDIKYLSENNSPMFELKNETFKSQKDKYMTCGEYKLLVKPYSELKISATLVELLRLLQNSLCRLIPQHVRLKLLMLSIFKVPSTAPPLATGSFFSGTSLSSSLSSLGRYGKHSKHGKLEKLERTGMKHGQEDGKQSGEENLKKKKKKVLGGKRYHKQSTIGRTLFTIKQAFATSNEQSVLDRFAFYMPETIWEGALEK